MSIREAELRDAAAMAWVSVDSYRATYRDQILEQSLMQFTLRPAFGLACRYSLSFALRLMPSG